MSFNPNFPAQLDLLPPKKAISNGDFIDLLIKARAELAELKGASGQIPNPMLLCSPLLIKESVESSGIENINTTVSNVLENQLLPLDEQGKADKEVLRYREALFWGLRNIPSLAMTNRLILGIHKELMGIDGGSYRRLQNHIVNSKTHEILYTPPIQSKIPELISNWEKYVNENKDIDPLIRIAIGHQQFESIHPFEDGNGRAGRILIVLGLVNDNLLELPILFISEYINQNRSEYYRLLRKVSSDEDWYEYIEFMLNGFYLQAKKTKDTLILVTNLQRELKDKIKINHKKIYTADLIESLFSYPIITPTKLAGMLQIHHTTASKYLHELAESNILTSAKVGRNHFFVNYDLVKLLNR